MIKVDRRLKRYLLSTSFLFPVLHLHNEKVVTLRIIKKGDKKRNMDFIYILFI